MKCVICRFAVADATRRVPTCDAEFITVADATRRVPTCDAEFIAVADATRRVPTCYFGRVCPLPLMTHL